MDWKLNQIEWQENNPDGTRYSLLEGVKDRPGEPFVYAFFIPAGFWDNPHFHSAQSQLKVLSGELKLGYGQHLDKSGAVAYPAGSWLTVPKQAIHFDGAETDTVIVGKATGPWATVYADPAKKAYQLLGPDGKLYLSETKGQYGGHTGGKGYGRMDCRAALQAIQRGGYVQSRVFFADEEAAVAAGYRPCGTCLPDRYRLWRQACSETGVDPATTSRERRTPVLTRYRELLGL